MLSEISQAEKENHMVSFIFWNIRNSRKIGRRRKGRMKGGKQKGE